MNEKTLKNFHAQFQTFDDPQETSESVPRLVALRAELARRGLDGFVVPHADRFQNEYLPPSEERLAWLTGFTGSAGAAVILAECAVLFVDGRYTLQARDQTDPKLFTIEHLVDKPPSAAPWRDRAARSAIRRRARRAKARTHSRRDQEAQCRRACGLRSARRRLDVQHPWRRRFPHAAAARLRDHPGGRRAALRR